MVPTTVLARQHVETFRKRFAPIGIEVGSLPRVASTAEERKVREGQRSGELKVVVGTLSLASKEIKCADLGLVIGSQGRPRRNVRSLDSGAEPADRGASSLDYVQSQAVRRDIYARAARCRTDDELEELQDETAPLRTAAAGGQQPFRNRQAQMSCRECGIMRLSTWAGSDCGNAAVGELIRRSCSRFLQRDDTWVIMPGGATRRSCKESNSFWICWMKSGCHYGISDARY
ncbi:hypothetical protein ACQR0V_23810 [Bradyrhizobium sp. HKCCYLS2058]|uniref:hypothetical protein n=1 Tax=unclassified Bradyrhizobium TaxID=2631580 RepID=UPI003EBFD037